MPPKYCLVLCACPGDAVARNIAEILVSNHLAACVNILPGITSVYAWEGKIESDREQLMLIKTDLNHYTKLESCIVEHHPHELPEVIAVPLQHGHSEYLAWISRWLDSKN